ncbi:outer membrane beta-barrel protein [Marinifilum flexuosum]|uniref:Outer membrane protein with beta-barrel domain n=1 Tax=Marinifilum flexuosum TaxID=1117708 RepID=A0A419X5Z7_9BACT|nr:outer membrane beta-barrel protein [Marinifilum flexuosum]RKE03122.1 outer membrane protein with beta-barrel domain [Marinifilum flexuosum]
MKKLLVMYFALAIGCSAYAQNTIDTLKTDTLKKKKILIEDSWSNKKKKAKTKQTFQKFEHQDTMKVEFMNRDVVKAVETEGGAKIKVGKIGKFAYQEGRDTTKIRIGGKQINIIDGWHGTRIKIEKVHPWDPDQDKFFMEKEPEFRGHWAGFEMGINGFANEDYIGYSYDFMELDMAKSIAVNLNFLQYDISLQKERNTIGLVTGLGLEWNNYRFDNDITLQKVNGVIQPLDLSVSHPDWDIKKTKLTTLYLTIPLLMEFQIPVKYKKRRIHMSAGVVGGLRLGSHTKIKHGGDKDKDHDDFKLKTLRYAAHARIGYRSLNFFATYGLTELFESGKGPDLTPFTVGITLVSF